jgi:hypothetical protein
MAKKKPTTIHAIMNELVDRTNSNTQRLRVLEQRGEVLDSRANSMEQDILNLNRNIQGFMSDMDARIKLQEDIIRKSDNTLKEVIKRIKSLATTTRISELEHLIDLYNPLKSQFVTKEEVERIIEEKKNK